jgi:protein gp37
MADNSKIELTDATWNPVAGCALVSPGCTNCYAMKVAARNAIGTMPQPNYVGLTKPSKAGEVWTGKIALVESALTKPLAWRKPRRIFVNSMSDLFHEDVPDSYIDKVFAVMALAPQHTLQVLTKRAGRMRGYLFGDGLAARIAAAGARMMEDGDNVHDRLLGLAWPLPNVWLGVSVEDQARADERIPLLLDTPAALRWISAEPLLGPVDLKRTGYGVHDDFKDCGGHPDPAYPPDSVGVGYTDALRGEYWHGTRTPDGQEPRASWEVGIRYPRLDWVVAGGESGAKARPMHPDWARALRDQCDAAGVPFFFKQWGEWGPQITDYPVRDSHRWPIAFEGDTTMSYRLGKKAAGRVLDGRTHDEYPR